jgi:hypothetical protein
MRRAKEMEDFVRNMFFKTGPEMDERLRADILRTQQQSQGMHLALGQVKIRRIIVRSPITKLAAAAVIVAAIVVTVGLWDKSVPSAYAVEQTLQALHSVRTLHIRDLAPDQNEPKEFWIECDETGELANVRMHVPAWDSPADGAKEVVWHAGKAQVWFRAKGTVVTVNEKEKISQLLGLVAAYDPKGVLERVMGLQEQGRAQVQIEQPSNKSEPIVVTVTSKRDGQDIQDVLTVNQATRLLESNHRYRLVNGQSEYLGADEFLSYNQPIDPNMFELTDLPEDVVKMDQTRPDVGLAKGSLTHEQIAEKVARTFFEALIAGDYDAAGRLLEGATGAVLKKAFAGIRFVRIVSIGPAAPHPLPQTGGLAVPCVIEIEKAGKIETTTYKDLGVRPVYGQPDRWVVFGGL